MRPNVKTLDLAVRAFRRPTSTLYIGAVTNRTNVGDDLLFDAHEFILGQKLAYLPIGGRDRLFSFRNLFSSPSILLGGGTLIGRPAYRAALESAVKIPGAQFSMLGVGVSAPDGRGKSDLPELRSWRNVLSEFEVVRVRGPRSQNDLSRVGIESVVTGDPALVTVHRLRAGLALPASSEILRIAINIAAVPAMAEAQVEILNALCSLRRLYQIGPISVVVAAPYDKDSAQQFVAQLQDAGFATELLLFHQMDDREIVEAVRVHNVVLGVRLHILVIAAAAGVPYISLAYEDKCSDFQESVEGEPWTTDLVCVSSDWIYRSLSELLREPESQTGRVERAVKHLVRTLEAAAPAVAAELR